VARQQANFNFVSRVWPPMNEETIKSIYSDFLFAGGVVKIIRLDLRGFFAWAYGIDGFDKRWMIYE